MSVWHVPHVDRYLPPGTVRNARFFIGIVNAAEMGILSAGQHLMGMSYTSRHRPYEGYNPASAARLPPWITAPSSPLCGVTA